MLNVPNPSPGRCHFDNIVLTEGGADPNYFPCISDMDRQIERFRSKLQCWPDSQEGRLSQLTDSTATCIAEKYRYDKAVGGGALPMATTPYIEVEQNRIVYDDGWDGRIGRKMLIPFLPPRVSRSYADANQTISYYPTSAALSYASPKLGPVAGGTAVTMIGTNFFHSDEITVLLDGVKVPGSYVSTTAVRFTTPPSKQTGRRSLDLSFNAQQGLATTGGARLEFIVYPNPTVTGMQPVSGPVNGGSTVLITGRNFHYMNLGSGLNPQGIWQNMRCRFSRACATNGLNCAIPPLLEVVPGSASSSLLNCTSPRAFTPGKVDVFVSFNRQQWTKVPQQFEFTPEVRKQKGTCVTGSMLLPPQSGGAPVALPGSVLGGSTCTTSRACRTLMIARRDRVSCMATSATSNLKRCFFDAFDGVQTSETVPLMFPLTGMLHTRCYPATWWVDNKWCLDEILRSSPHCAGSPACYTSSGVWLPGTDCTQKADCQSMAPSSFTCTSGRCHFAVYQQEYDTANHPAPKPVVLPNWNVTCSTAADCFRKAAPVCGNNRVCQVGIAYGGGVLNGLSCSTDGECQSRFQAELPLTGAAKAMSCHSGDKVCHYKHRVVQGWKAMSCSTEADCKASAVAASLRCKIFTNAWQASPEYGPTTGATNVTITGDQFRPTQFLQCRFRSHAATSGGFFVPGTYINASSVVCATPLVATTTSQALYSLEVTQDGQTYTVSGLNFTFYRPNIAVTSFFPRSGPFSGGTSIVIRGTGFVDADRGATGKWIRCLFDELSTPGVYVDDTTLTCVSPPRPAGIGTTEFRISFSGGQNRYANAAGKSLFGLSAFRFYPSTVGLTALYPPHGLASGGTDVTIAGQGFEETGSIRVRFGSSLAALTVSGRYISATQITCLSPAVNYTLLSNFSTQPHAYNFSQDGHEVGPTEGSGNRRQVEVRVSLNAQDYSVHASPFWVYDTPNVTLLEPTSGPQYGGTMVTIHGENFVGGNIRDYNKHAGFLEPKIRFISGKPAITVTVAGSWKALSRPGYENNTNGVETKRYAIVCYTPASISVLGRNPPSALLQISLNSQQWNTSYVWSWNATGAHYFNLPDIRFIYYAAPVTVLTVQPPVGPVTGGTVVTVSGLNFTETGQIECRFGYTRTGYFFKANLVRGKISPTDPKSILCTAPSTEMTYAWTEQKLVSQFQQRVELEVALNGQQFSSSRRNFLFHPGVTS